MEGVKDKKMKSLTRKSSRLAEPAND
jgi:hypothetical protein